MNTVKYNELEVKLEAFLGPLITNTNTNTREVSRGCHCPAFSGGWVSRLLPTLSICSPPNTFNTHLLYPPNALSLLVPNTSYTHLLYTPALTPSPSPPYLSVPPNTFIDQHLISASISPDPRDLVPNTSYTHLLRSALMFSLLVWCFSQL